MPRYMPSTKPKGKDSSHCMVLFCKASSNDPNVCYFRLTAARHDSWLRALGRDPTVEQLSQGNRICSMHFAKEDLITTSPGHTSLKIGAIPKLNMGVRRNVSLPQQQILPSKGLLERNNSVIQRAAPLEPITALPHMVQQIASHQIISEDPEINSNSTAVSGELGVKQEIENVNDIIRKLPTSYPVQKNHIIDTETQAYFITKRTIEKNEEKIKNLKLKYKKLKKRLTKVNNILENLGDSCDIVKVTEVTEQLLNGPNNIINNVDGSSTESGEEGNEESEDIKIEIVDHDLNDEVSSLGINEQDVITIDDDVEENIPIHSLTTESQVQVTFLAGSDTAKEGLLKRKLKQLAENDVIKSKKIRELNNIIFLKNKLIGELRNEIAKLKDEQQKKPTQSPILRVLHPNSLK